MDAKARTRIRLGGLAALVVVGVAIWLLSSGGDSTPEANGAEIVSVNELREASAPRATPIYWAGERPGAELELSEAEGGRTYVRYLTGGAQANDPRAGFLTVGTYRVANPVAALREQGRKPGGVTTRGPAGSTVYFDRKGPHSVYVAFPGVGAEIEVYDPNFETALRLVDSGKIVPVS
jgi:hypothetical protein